MANNRQVMIPSPEMGDQWYAFQRERHSNPGEHFLISTGLASVDESIGGGFSRPSYTVIGGAPKISKSTFLLHCMKAAARQGITCGWFGAEMGLNDTAGIMVASISQVERDKIRKIVKVNDTYHSMLEEEHWAILWKAVEEMKEYPVYWNYGVRTIDDIKACWYYAKEKFGVELQMIFVDYAQLLTDNNFKTRTEKLEAVSQGFMSLKEFFGVPVTSVVASQIGREDARTGQYDMTSLLGSGDFERSANNVGIIGKVPDTEDPELFVPNMRRIHWVALRESAGEDLGYVDIGFNGAYGTFFDLEEGANRSSIRWT